MQNKCSRHECKASRTCVTPPARPTIRRLRCNRRLFGNRHIRRLLRLWAFVVSRMRRNIVLILALIKVRNGATGSRLNTCDTRLVVNQFDGLCEDARLLKAIFPRNAGQIFARFRGRAESFRTLRPLGRAPADSECLFAKIKKIDRREIRSHMRIDGNVKLFAFKIPIIFQQNRGDRIRQRRWHVRSSFAWR